MPRRHHIALVGADLPAMACAVETGRSHPRVELDVAALALLLPEKARPAPAPAATATALQMSHFFKLEWFE